MYKGNLESFFEEVDTSSDSFTEIPQIRGDPCVVFKKLSIGSAYITRDNAGKFQLVYKKVKYF